MSEYTALGQNCAGETPSQVSGHLLADMAVYLRANTFTTKDAMAVSVLLRKLDEGVQAALKESAQAACRSIFEAQSHKRKRESRRSPSWSAM